MVRVGGRQIRPTRMRSSGEFAGVGSPSQGALSQLDELSAAGPAPCAYTGKGIRLQPTEGFRMPRYESVLEAIGGTPLIRLTRSARDLRPRIYVKPEWQNPGGSVKDRAALSMQIGRAHV